MVWDPCVAFDEMMINFITEGRSLWEVEKAYFCMIVQVHRNKKVVARVLEISRANVYLHLNKWEADPHLLELVQGVPYMPQWLFAYFFMQASVDWWGSKRTAARHLRITRTTLANKLKKAEQRLSS